MDNSPAPTLLTAERYIERVTANQASLQRSLLVLIALAAFALAIENSYGRFIDIQAKHESVERSDRNVALERSALAAQSRQVLISSVKGGRNPTRSDELSAAREDLQKAEERREQLKRELEALEGQPVSLTIAGTNLPSQLSYAPVLWLGALVAWLMFFEARRAAVHRNLAAAAVATTASGPRYGSAGDGSVWIAPIPGSLCFQDSAGTLHRVSRKEMHALLGWTPRTEMRYQLGLGLFAVLIGVIALRILSIGWAITGDFAIAEGFGDRSWQIPSTILSLVLFFIAIVCLLRVPKSMAGDADAPVVGRRTLVFGLICVSASVSAGAFRSRLPDLSALASGLFLDTSAKTQKRPWFIKQSKRLARKRSREVYHPAPYAPGTILYNRLSAKAEEGLATLHVVGSKKTVRFFSPVSEVRHLAPLPFQALAKAWASPDGVALRGDGRLKVDPRQTTAIEAAALERIATGELVAGCDLLLAGARLSLQVPPNQQVNWRLLDLLSGLAVRYRYESRYLEPLRIMMAARQSVQDQLLVKERAKLASRVAKWNDSGTAWHQRWRDRSKPHRWHHPIELDDASDGRPRVIKIA